MSLAASTQNVNLVGWNSNPAPDFGDNGRWYHNATPWSRAYYVRAGRGGQ